MQGEPKSHWTNLVLILPWFPSISPAN